MSYTSAPSSRIVRSVAYVIFGAIPATMKVLYGIGGLVMSIVLIPKFSLIVLPWLIAGLYGTIAIWHISFTPIPNNKPVRKNIFYGLFLGFLAYMPFLLISIESAVKKLNIAIKEMEFFFSNFNQHSSTFSDFLWNTSPIFVIVHYFYSNREFFRGC